MLATRKIEVLEKLGAGPKTYPISRFLKNPWAEWVMGGNPGMEYIKNMTYAQRLQGKARMGTGLKNKLTDMTTAEEKKIIRALRADSPKSRARGAAKQTAGVAAAGLGGVAAGSALKEKKAGASTYPIQRFIHNPLAGIPPLKFLQNKIGARALLGTSRVPPSELRALSGHEERIVDALRATSRGGRKRTAAATAAAGTLAAALGVAAAPGRRKKKD